MDFPAHGQSEKPEETWGVKDFALCVQELMGKLERAGLIARTESAEDRRTADVRLTEAGRAALSEGKREKPDLFSAMSDKEKDELIVLLEKLRGSWREKLHEERAGHECCHKHGRCHEPGDDSKAD